VRHLYRYGLAAAAAALTLAAAAGPAAAAHQRTPAAAHPARHWGAGPPTNGFSRSGPWNTKLPATVPLAPNSAAIVHNLALDEADNFGSWAVNTDSYSTPVFTAGPGTPAQNWTFSDCLNMPQLAPVIADSFTAVPTPPDLITSQGTDESTTIYQPSTDTYWDFWRAEKDASGHWSACWGGKISHYSRNPGIFANPLGATATGLPLGAFTIRISELQSGHIDHAINIATVRTQANCFSWPASRDDGNTTGSDIPCEGERFRLDPSFNVNTLYSPAARIIARAMQQYGLILTDKAGALVTYAEDPRPYMAAHGGADPYQPLMDPLNLFPAGTARFAILTQIPVSRLQALPLGYGEPPAAAGSPGTAPGAGVLGRHSP
jgi:hypothetical protein